MHTIKAFWTEKRFLKLFIFALLLANLTSYCVWQIARNQVATNAISHNNKVYTAFLQAVERARKSGAAQTGVTSGPVAPATATANPGPQPAATAAAAPKANTSSPYWQGLYETRKEFPYVRTNIVLPNTVEGDREHKALDILKTRPRDWMYAETQSGWTRSFYVLPTRNTAALLVMSDVRDDLTSWETTSYIIGAYAFVLLFAFGWFWTRALDEATDSPPGLELEFKKRLQTVREITAEMTAALGQISSSLESIEGRQDLKTIADMASQIRLLAVNGSIEAARSAETHRVFHVLMQEINKLAVQTRDRISASNSSWDELPALRRKVEGLLSQLNGQAEAVPPRSVSKSSSVTAFRRVG